MVKDYIVHKILSEKPLTPFAPDYKLYIGIFNLREFIDLKKIKQIVYEKKDKIINSIDEKNADDHYTGLGKKSLTARSKHFNIFDWNCEEVQLLKKYIKECHSIFLKEISLNVNDFSNVYIKGWANVMKNGEKIKTHLHNAGASCYLGGHFCVQVENTSTFYINPINTINDPDVYEIENVLGQLTLFTNYMPHHTSINNSKDDRITIAFDLSTIDKNNLQVLL
jgi:hypothetical protein